MTDDEDPNDAKLKQLWIETKAHCRRVGCTCDPDIAFVHQGGGLFTSDIKHDDWCPLLKLVKESGKS